ncbi:unnamed protein product [Closterium sp. NIES-53]
MKKKNSRAAPGAATIAAAAPGAAATAAAAPGAAATAAAAPGEAATAAAAPGAAATAAAAPGAAATNWYASWGCRGGRSGSRPGVRSSAAACSGQVHLQRRPRAVLSPQQLREWYAQRDGSRGTARCPYVIRTGARTGQPRGTLGHAESRCFARLSDAWCTEFGDAAELPDWVELLRLRVDIYTLDYDAILTAMYALPTSDEGDCYLCVPPSPSIEAAALGAGEAAALGACASAASGTGESALLGTASAQVFHTFTLDSGASRSFFRDRTTLTPLSRPVVVSLADPSGGPVLASFSTVLPCPAAPSGTLSGLYLPSFSTNLVSGADLQDQGVDQFTPASQRVTRCTCARTGRHLATFTRRSGSSLYTLSTESPPVPASSQVFAAASESGPESAPCLGRLLSHQTLLWHHRLVHPSLPRLRGMASRVLVSGLPRSLPPLPPGPAPTCVPCVEGRQRAAPHSSKFPPTEAPLQTLHMDVWGPARVRGQGHERYFLLVVDDYSRYTTVFPLRSKGDVTEVLIDWIRAARLQLKESFGSDFPVLRLHSDSGGEFSSARLGAFCRAQGIHQTFTLPASPQQNGIAERRIGMVMDVARTSMIHAAAPHFLWPFVVQYAAHQLNLQPRVSLPETSPTLRWTGKVGDASAFRVWGSRATSGLGLVLGGRRPVVLTGHADASWADDQATQRSSQGYTFSLGSGSELRWLTYLLTNLGELPRSPPVLYVKNKSMLVLCREHRLEHRTKHIALRYFLARELQQRGQLRLAYVAFEANTADIFTKALPPGDHQRFCTMLACFTLLEWSCDLLFSLTLPMGHRLEHRTKHIALRYFLARELQQRGQLRLAYVASQANTADIFTKALQPCDHQRFCTMLGLVPTWPHLLTS